MELAFRLHEPLDQPPHNTMREEILAGFSASPKWASPKYFYDRRGSALFERICQQPEYYLTRTEESILAGVSGEICALAGPETDLIEFGSGASRKVRLLLECLRPASYLGLDISADFLLASTRQLAQDYPWLEVHAAACDFSRRVRLPADFRGRRPLAFFPGSSIGNFTPAQARRFLLELARLLPPGGGLLIGVDLAKEPALLEAAYNDRAQVTAAFNLNLLEHIRASLDTDLEPSRFEHYAWFNAAESRVEMHLRSREAQTVRLEGQQFHFAEGETLHTENSYKYSPESFCALARSAGFACRRCWTDEQRLFSVHYLSRA